MHRVWILFLAVLLGAAGIALGPSAFAGVDSASSWSAEQGIRVGSEWLGPVSVFPRSNMTVWRSALRPPPGDSDLVLTLVFSEAQGGFARLIWQGAGRAVTLCGNLYETGLRRHQRTLLIRRETLGGSGQMIVESTGPLPVLERVELRWVQPRILVSEGAGLGGFFCGVSEKFFGTEDLRPEGWRPWDDHAVEGVMDALVDAGPISVEAQTPVRFLLPIRGPVGHGRIEVSVAGMTPEGEPQIVVNETKLSSVSVEVPGLADPGYCPDPGGAAWNYAGWRKVTAYLPPGVLREGSNQIDWFLGERGASHTLRDFRLQVTAGRAGFPRTQAAIPPPPSQAVRVPEPTARISFRGELSSHRTRLALRQE